MNALLTPGGVVKHLKYILSNEIVLQYNVDGTHGKKCLKQLNMFYTTIIGKNIFLFFHSLLLPTLSCRINKSIKLRSTRTTIEKSVSAPEETSFQSNFNKQINKFIIYNIKY